MVQLGLDYPVSQCNLLDLLVLDYLHRLGYQYIQLDLMVLDRLYFRYNLLGLVDPVHLVIQYIQSTRCNQLVLLDLVCLDYQYILLVLVDLVHPVIQYSQLNQYNL